MPFIKILKSHWTQPDKKGVHLIEGTTPFVDEDRAAAAIGAGLAEKADAESIDRLAVRMFGEDGKEIVQNQKSK